MINYNYRKTQPPPTPPTWMGIKSDLCKILLTGIGFCILLLFIASCDRADSSQPITVGISPDLYPLSYSVGDSLRGIEIELLEMIEQRQKVVINKQVVGISQLLESLERGDIDMAISGITITDRRREVFDFSLPYYDATQTILSLQTKSNLDSLGVLVNAKVGVINNSTSLIFAEETLIRRHYLAIGNLVRYQNLSALTNALKNYDIDYIILEHTRGAIIQQQFGLSIVYRNEVEEKFAIAYQPSFPSAKSLNRTIERILRSEDWKKVLMKFEI